MHAHTYIHIRMLRDTHTHTHTHTHVHTQEANPEAFSKLDMTRVGVLVGTGMGGLTVFQDGKRPVCVRWLCAER